MNKMNKKGFTLIEMLVVIAIIAILVAIIIPVVSAATERATESRDAANIRAAIAQVSADGLATNTNKEATVVLKQTDKDFTYITDKIGSFDPSEFKGMAEVKVTFTASTGAITISKVS